MRDEVSNADKLLGNLAKDVFGSSNRVYPKPLHSKLSKIFLFLLLLFYSLIIITTVRNLVLFFDTHATTYFIRLGILAAILQILGSEKHYLLYVNYAPDLLDSDINQRNFSLVQTMLSNVILGTLIVATYFGVGSLSNFTFSQLSIATFVVIIAIFYVNFSDISLISQGLGMSIIEFTSGLKTPYRNWKRTSALSNSLSKRIALTRFSYVLAISSIVITNYNPLLLGVLPLLYTIFGYYFERKNVSKLVMRIRGKLNELTPGSIPEDIPEEENENSHPLEIPFKPVINKIKRINNFRPLQASKPNVNIGNMTNDSGNSNSQKIADDLSPYAARTLNRIIQKVKSEGPLQPRGQIHYCMNCGSPTSSEGTFCTQCGSNPQ